MNSAGLVETGIVYLELAPVYTCNLKISPDELTICTRDQICSDDLVQEWWVDQESIFSLDNWIVELKMFCTPKQYISLIGSIAFSGATIACLFLPIAGDRYGRWIVFQITMGLQIPMYFAAIYSKSLWVIYVFIFYLGVSLIGRWTCGFVMLTELIPEKYQTFAATALMTGDSAATLYLTFYYRFISKNSYPIFWFSRFIVSLYRNLTHPISDYQD